MIDRPTWHPVNKPLVPRRKTTVRVVGRRTSIAGVDPNPDGVARKDQVVVDSWYHAGSGEIYVNARVPLVSWHEPDGVTPVWRNRHVCDVGVDGVFGVDDARVLVEMLQNAITDIEERQSDDVR